jgi:hypothetical protein
MNHNESWIDKELKGCKFQDQRLKKRMKMFLHNLSDGIGESIPLACQDWANTKAAYRFLSNNRVSEEYVLKGHFQATSDRFSAANDKLLVLHDTTEFSFKRKEPSRIGSTRITTSGKDSRGDLRLHTICGILMHASLAVTTEGTPLGLAAIKFWTRKKFKGCNKLKKKINPTRIPINKKESIRWLENLQYSTELLKKPQSCVHIGDRESDIYELFCMAQQLETHFLVRTCV